jgi:hypothetical protein
MSRVITLVLPVEAAALADVALAPGLDSFAGVWFGVVDNGLWRAMRVFAEFWSSHTANEGGTGIEVTPFDHLAPDFVEQQRALGPFGRRVRGVVTGLGN